MLRKSLIGLLCTALTVSGSIGRAAAAEQFNDLQCRIEFIDKDICNVSFFKKFLSVRMLKSGSAERIFYKNIVRWSYENASLRKRSSLISTKVARMAFTFLFCNLPLASFSAVGNIANTYMYWPSDNGEWSMTLEIETLENAFDEFSTIETRLGDRS